MSQIIEHEFLVDDQGNLVLLIDSLSSEEPVNPVFLVSPTEETGFLRRHFESKDFHQVMGISPDVIQRLREADDIVIIELDGKTVAHSYAVFTELADE